MKKKCYETACATVFSNIAGGKDIVTLSWIADGTGDEVGLDELGGP